MAFGYEYWMVYLPAFNAESFLLFVNNPAGSTKLRDYSSGRARVLVQPPLDVLRSTTIDKTRFSYEPHVTTDDYFWATETRNLNTRCLALSLHVSPAIHAAESPAAGILHSRNVITGRARRGSQRQLQDYVNDHQEVLTRAVIEALPPRYAELGATISWVSPLAHENYLEYRDGDFLRAVGLGEWAGELQTFWPTGGPSWDALGIISDPNQRIRPNIVLVEAKSHLPEIYGSGCQAGPRSLELIQRSLAVAKESYGASRDADWVGPLYQSANRLAHLYFMRERLKRFAWLVNLCFVDDPIGPASHEDWEAELKQVKSALGILSLVPFMVDVFLPALNCVEPNDSSKPEDSSLKPDDGSTIVVCETDMPASSLITARSIQEGIPMEFNSFATWANRWMALASYAGSSVPEVANRIEQLIRLWEAPIPGSWQRGVDQQLMGSCYRRSDFDRPHTGEHTIEHEVLGQNLKRISCLGYKLLDGVNAFPLVLDEGGGRSANVEADMLLLGELDGAHRLFLCEVKNRANDPWYAVVESLRQLRLFLANAEARAIFATRGSIVGLPAVIPVTGLVLAPSEYYSSRGKKQNAVKPSSELIVRFAARFGVDLRLAVWDVANCQIRNAPPGSRFTPSSLLS